MWVQVEPSISRLSSINRLELFFRPNVINLDLLDIDVFQDCHNGFQAWYSLEC